MLLGTNYMLAAIISFILQLVIVPVTIRRMHDGGHSGIWVVAAVLLNVAANVYGFMNGFASLGDLSPEEVMSVISNPAFIGLTLASMVVQTVIFIFAVMEGDKGENQYGASTKYIVE